MVFVCFGSVGGNLLGVGSSSISPSDMSETEPLLACLLPSFALFPAILPLVAGFETFVGLPNEGACDFAEELGPVGTRWRLLGWLKFFFSCLAWRRSQS